MIFNVERKIILDLYSVTEARRGYSWGLSSNLSKGREVSSLFP